MMRVALAGLALLVCAVPAAADECFYASVAFERGTIQLGTATAGKSYFHDDEFERTKAFVLKGDEVLVDTSQSQGNEWLCVAYIGKKGVATWGFIKASDF